MNAYQSYATLISEMRAAIESNLPRALREAGIPPEDYAAIIARVLGRVPSDPGSSDGKGLDPAMVVGLGLLKAPRNERGFALAPVSDEVRRSFVQVAFNDYTWNEDDYLDAEFTELVEGLDLVMVTRDIGGDMPLDIVGLTHQIDVWRQTAKSPLVTRTRALAAYKAMKDGPTAGLRANVYA